MQLRRGRNGNPRPKCNGKHTLPVVADASVTVRPRRVAIARQNPCKSVVRKASTFWRVAKPSSLSNTRSSFNCNSNLSVCRPSVTLVVSISTGGQVADPRKRKRFVPWAIRMRRFFVAFSAISPLLALVSCQISSKCWKMMQLDAQLTACPPPDTFYDDFSSCVNGQPDPSKWQMISRQWVRYPVLDSAFFLLSPPC
jgi:hypothetical protein